MEFEVTVTHKRVEKFTVEADDAGEAATMWRGTNPVEVTEDQISDVEIRRV